MSTHRQVFLLFFFCFTIDYDNAFTVQFSDLVMFFSTRCISSYRLHICLSFCVSLFSAVYMDLYF